MGLFHGLMWSIVAGVAVRLVPPASAGRATAAVFSGISLALVLGVPAGTAVSARWGWHAVFALLAAMGAVTTMISVVTDSWSWFVRLETSSALGSTVGRSVVTAVLGISAAVFAWAASHIVRDIPFGPPPWRRATLDD
jgi:predicted MFS family arabinose efflux permease